MEETLQNKIDSIRLDLSRASDLALLAQSEGGQELVRALLDDIATAIDLLGMSAATATHVQMIELAVKLRERVALYRVLEGAEYNQSFLITVLKESLVKLKEQRDGGEPT